MRQTGADTQAVEKISQIVLGDAVIPESDFLSIHPKRDR